MIGISHAINTVIATRPRGRQFIGRASVSTGTIDFTNLTGGAIASGDWIGMFGIRANATLPSPSPATGWNALFADYAVAAPWQVIGWWKNYAPGDTDPMPTTHTKLAVVYRNCAIGTVSTPLTPGGTTMSIPALSAGGDWACAFWAAKIAQTDIVTSLTALGLNVRKNSLGTNNYAYADSGSASSGFSQINYTSATSNNFGVSFTLVRA